jgi:hypothetical protein
MILTRMCMIRMVRQTLIRGAFGNEEHVMRRNISRIAAVSMAAALAATAIDLRPASAAPRAPDIRAAKDVGNLDISSQRRRYNRGHRGHRGNAAGAAAVLGVFGAIAGAAAANSYRRDYYEPYGYYGRPAYGGYYGAPAYGGFYGGPGYYRRW